MMRKYKERARARESERHSSNKSGLKLFFSS